MTTLKIGDRVMVTNERDPQTGRIHAYSDQAGEVVEINAMGTAWVRFDNAKPAWLYPVKVAKLVPESPVTRPDLGEAIERAFLALHMITPGGPQAFAERQIDEALRALNTARDLLKPHR